MMKSLIVFLGLAAATAATAQDEPQLCYPAPIVAATVRVIVDQVSLIARQRAEIDALRRKLAEHGIDPTPELWTILQQLEAERNRQQGAQ